MALARECRSSRLQGNAVEFITALEYGQPLISMPPAMMTQPGTAIHYSAMLFMYNLAESYIGVHASSKLSGSREHNNQSLSLHLSRTCCIHGTEIRRSFFMRPLEYIASYCTLYSGARVTVVRYTNNMRTHVPFMWGSLRLVTTS